MKEILLYQPLSLSKEQTTQMIDSRFYLTSLIGIPDKQPMTSHLYEMTSTADVSSLPNGVLCTKERLMFDKLHAARVINQRVSSNSRFTMIGL